MWKYIHVYIKQLLLPWFEKKVRFWKKKKKLLVVSTAKLFKASIFFSYTGKVPRTYFKPFNKGFKTLTDGNFSLLQKLYFLADKWRVSSPVESAAGARLISKAEKVVVAEPLKQREKISSSLDQTSTGT